MYDLYAYTTAGDRRYAEAMAGLLDPQGEYFAEKVISREDSTQDGRKGLDVVLGHPSAVVVLDHDPAVWREEDRGNVVHVKVYSWGSEEECGGVLAKMLGLLRKIHSGYFRKDRHGEDVRAVIRSLKREVLRGCRLLLLLLLRDAHPWTRVAEEMGATCVGEEEGDADATHVVCDDIYGEDAKWALERWKVVVGLDWLRTAHYTWERPPEEEFLEMLVLSD